ncbi:MAG: hypothetical protein ACRDQA_09025 [Nocardioidaceae bacterium]
MAYPAKYSQLNAMEVTPDGRRMLVRVLRVAFPHRSVPDGPYERTADTIISEAEVSTWFRVVLTEGLNSLNMLADGQFVDLDDAAALKVLRHIEGTDFFGFIRRTTVLNLYGDEEVWAALGYEGPSFDQGGYVNRGFDDLDWLPEARITEYDGPEQLNDITPTVAAPPGATAPRPDTRTQPGATETEMGKVRK